MTKPSHHGAGTVPARGISVRQPWAWAIARGWKPVENRTRAFPSKLIGVPIALHASLTPEPEAFPPDSGARAALAAAEAEDPLLALGAVIAVVTFSGSHVTCRSGLGGPVCTSWSETARDHWVVDSAQPLAEPVPCRGMQGFWPVPDSVAEAVAAQLPAAVQGGTREAATA